VPAATTERQVCLRCGAARLVRAPDGRVAGDAAPPPPARRCRVSFRNPYRRSPPMSPPRTPASPPPWTAFGAFLGLLALLAAAGLHPAVWQHLAGLAAVAGVAAATAPLERRRRDHAAHTAFTAS
jgi:hypothetical protein